LNCTGKATSCIVPDNNIVKSRTLFAGTNSNHNAAPSIHGSSDGSTVTNRNVIELIAYGQSAKPDRCVILSFNVATHRVVSNNSVVATSSVEAKGIFANGDVVGAGVIE
jgi:hypothetical protein